MLDQIPLPNQMLETVFNKMGSLGLPTHLVCDHICYRVATMERYNFLKQAFGTIADLSSEVPIAGRPISIFTLHTPYRFGEYEIRCIELPAPKSGSTYPEGWEHAEFVTGEDLQTFMARYPHITFDQRAIGKPLNPEVGLKLTDQYQVKFHPRHIIDVIALEKQGLMP